MKPIIYYRKSLMDKNELASARGHFECVNLLTDIPENRLVIPKYSALPYHLDLQREIKNIGSTLINSYSQHVYIADLQNWVADLKDYTPQTWKELYNLPDNTAFVLKGETNSKKFNWSTMMYAANKQEAIQVANRLSNDGLVGEQQIYIREYVPLVKLMDGFNGMPVTMEFRFFIAYGKVLCGDYYWANYVDDLPEKPDVNMVPFDFLQKIINIVDDKCNFYVIDVGLTQSGEWIVIELNDGTCSGLSCNEPEKLYNNLWSVLNAKFDM